MFKDGHMIYFIVNENSCTGKSRHTWQRIREILKKEHVCYRAFRTRYKGHAKELAEKICSQEDSDICLVVVGGDGTLNEVLNGMKNFERVRLGLIPAGSGNDFARGLKFSRNPEENLCDILENIRKGPDAFRRIDIGKVCWSSSLDSSTESKGDAAGAAGERLFGISSGIGMDAIVCKKANDTRLKTFLNRLHLGNLTYVLLTVQTLFGMETMEAEAVFKLPEKGEWVQRKEKMIFLSAMNLPFEGGGVPMAPGASVTDGRLSFCCAAGIPKWRAFFCLPVLLAAKHEKIKGFSLMHAVSLKLQLSKPAVIHADGEYCGTSRELTFWCLPGIVKLCNT